MKLWKKIIIGIGLAIPSSKVKVLGYKMIGAEVGRNVRIRSKSYIIADKITIMDGVIIEPNVHIVCDELFMGEETKIDSETTVFGEGRLEMKDGSYIGPRAWINCTAPIVLGKNTGVGPGSMIFTHGVWLPYIDGYPRKFSEVILEDGVWVPAGVTILPGVRIGKGAMIGTGALVNKEVPPGMFATGVPAKVVSDMSKIIEEMTPEKKRERLNEMLQDYGRWIVKEGGRVENMGGGGTLAITRKKRIGYRRFGIHILDRQVNLGDIQNLQSSMTGLTSSILISFEGFDSESKRFMSNSKFYHWIDLKEGTCRRSWQKDFIHFRRFLARFYGTRFTLEGAV